MKLSTCLILAMGLILGCGESRESPWHEPLPVIFVELDSTAVQTPTLMKVEAVPAPEIRSLALLQPDPNHAIPVEAPVTGVVFRIAREHQAQRAETLAVMGEGSGPGGREIAIRGREVGNWRPRRAAGQFLWQDDTLGVLEQSGYFWAVGSVNESDARLVHRDDPAIVLIGESADPKRLRLPGRVEVVRAQGMSYMSRDVAVEVRTSRESLGVRGPVTIVIRPSGPEDSLAAVPAAAVAQLMLGSAVFVPAGTRRYEVRWVAAGPPVNGRIFVREGIRPGNSIVGGNLGPLVDAARDSLLKRPIKNPR